MNIQPASQATTAAQVQEDHHEYTSPLATRYASKRMTALFSESTKHSTWRRIWIALAQTQKELGLSISQEQIDQMCAYATNINFDRIDFYERQLRHDVMAHVHAYGEQCPQAKPIIHLGATSCLITDNADVLIMRSALQLIEQQVLQLIHQLAALAEQYKELPCLSFTHLQPAQPTTVGKRIALWLQDFVIDIHDLRNRIATIQLLGIKGATGTQASFLELFDGDHHKVIELEQRMIAKLGCTNVFMLSGQTYTRKQDVQILNVLTGLAVSAHKMATDLRLLTFMKEVDEPCEDKQIGSSAMPYKRNPMRSERVCSLARFVMSLNDNPMYTASTQWLERTLDDSANRRLCIPEAFLATDAILQLLINITQKLTFYPAMITQNLERELPFMAIEPILLACTKKGSDRQIIHEKLRQHCVFVSNNIKHYGTDNDLIARIISDPEIPLDEDELKKLLDVNLFIGRAPAQVTEFLQTIQSLLHQYKKQDQSTEISC